MLCGAVGRDFVADVDGSEVPVRYPVDDGGAVGFFVELDFCGTGAGGGYGMWGEVGVVAHCGCYWGLERVVDGKTVWSWAVLKMLEIRVR